MGMTPCAVYNLIFLRACDFGPLLLTSSYWCMVHSLYSVDLVLNNKTLLYYMLFIINQVQENVTKLLLTPIRARGELGANVFSTYELASM